VKSIEEIFRARRRRKKNGEREKDYKKRLIH